MPIRGKKSVASQVKSVDLSAISKATPYIQRVIQDATLRENVRTAYDSTRSAYARLTNGKAPAKALLEDKKLQRDLQHAVEALRDATTALSEAPKKPNPRKKGLRLGPEPAESSMLGAYRGRFEARYGPSREVPLLELLDPESRIFTAHMADPPAPVRAPVLEIADLRYLEQTLRGIEQRAIPQIPSVGLEVILSFPRVFPVRGAITFATGYTWNNR